MKKILTVLLAGAMLAGVVTLPAYAAEINISKKASCATQAEVLETKIIGSITYTKYADHTCVISGSGRLTDCSDFNRNSPFIDDSFTERVIIEDGITRIGSHFFHSCTSLKSVEMADSVTEIGTGAFADCYELTSIKLSENLRVIESYALHNTGLETLSIGDDLIYLGSSALPYKLKDFTMTSDKISYLGEKNFSKTPWLENMKKTSDMVIVGNILVDATACSGAVTIPNGIEIIDSDAFKNADITAVTIPESVKRIGKRAFYGCSSLTEINLPKSIEAIESNAFDGTPWYEEQSGDKDTVIIANVLMKYTPAESTVTIPDGVVYIPDNIFRDINGNNTVTSVAMPDSVKGIADGAFEFCMGLNTVQLSRNISIIPENTFSDCRNLSLITIPGEVEYIGSNVFEYGRPTVKAVVSSYAHDFAKEHNMTFMAIAESEEVLLSGSCGENAEYTLYGDNRLVISGSGAMYDYNAENKAPWNEYQLTSVEIADGITYIGAEAFHRCKHLKTAVLADSVERIGRGAFGDCERLADITLPQSLREIGESAFASCRGLDRVTLPASLEIIGESAFDGSSITAVEIPDGVTEISDFAFYGCRRLELVTLTENVTKIGEQSFAECPLVKFATDEGTYAYDYAMLKNIPVVNENIPMLLGDFNLDGVVTISDVTGMQRYFSENTIIPEVQNDIMDVNRDGKSDIKDVTALQRSLAGINIQN